MIPMVACHDDFEVLGTPRADRQPGQSGDEAVENARHSDEDRRLFPLVNSHDRIFGPHTPQRRTTTGVILITRPLREPAMNATPRLGAPSCQ